MRFSVFLVCSDITLFVSILRSFCLFFNLITKITLKTNKSMNPIILIANSIARNMKFSELVPVNLYVFVGAYVVRWNVSIGPNCPKVSLDNYIGVEIHVTAWCQRQWKHHNTIQYDSLLCKPSPCLKWVINTTDPVDWQENLQIKDYHASCLWQCYIKYQIHVAPRVRHGFW